MREIRRSAAPRCARRTLRKSPTEGRACGGSSYPRKIKAKKSPEKTRVECRRRGDTECGSSQEGVSSVQARDRGQAALRAGWPERAAVESGAQRQAHPHRATEATGAFQPRDDTICCVFEQSPQLPGGGLAGVRVGTIPSTPVRTQKAPTTISRAADL